MRALSRRYLLVLGLLASSPLTAQQTDPDRPAIDWTPVPLALEFAQTSGLYAQPQCQQQSWLSLPLHGVPGGRLWLGSSHYDQPCLPYRAHQPEALDLLRLPPRPALFPHGATTP